ncbi:hypothetical protein VFPPC_10631 [Pochonia chlamydosporia 170]|uniref:Uncharacterized protein n=1 Tax=Pochonia chlamydosporia 170 TaxID=1380566 RepID=A0A179F4V0_METCM|nr:hypothetical protein VFPPC_10631 [Pochonia chlamydosporia 170]OAQ60203.1 hypothetical protein VFPPC_10631 [Pochonia chlamydosporia 170]
MSPSILSPSALGIPPRSVGDEATTDLWLSEPYLDPLLVQNDESSLAALEAWPDILSCAPQASHSVHPKLPATPDPPVAWDAPFHSSSTTSSTDSCLQACIQLSQLSTSQIQSLCGRVQALEQNLKDAESKVEEFVSWSKKMEKHCQETTNTVLSLFKTIQKPEFLQDILKESRDC